MLEICLKPILFDFYRRKSLGFYYSHFLLQFYSSITVFLKNNSGVNENKLEKKVTYVVWTVNVSFVRFYK